MRPSRGDFARCRQLVAVRAGNQDIVKVLLEAEAAFDMRHARQKGHQAQQTEKKIKSKNKAFKLLGRASSRKSVMSDSSARAAASRRGKKNSVIGVFGLFGGGSNRNSTQPLRKANGQEERETNGPRRSSIGMGVLKDLVTNVTKDSISGTHFVDDLHLGFEFESGYPGAG